MAGKRLWSTNWPPVKTRNGWGPAASPVLHQDRLFIVNDKEYRVLPGANMLLVDFHPAPDKALCDGPQALLTRDLGKFLADVRIVREAYERRRALG